MVSLIFTSKMCKTVFDMYAAKDFNGYKIIDLII